MYKVIRQGKLERRKRIIKACIASGFFFSSERARERRSREGFVPSPNSLSTSPLARTEIPPATQAGMLNMDVICITWIVIMAMKIMKMLQLRMIAYLTRPILIFLNFIFFRPNGSIQGPHRHCIYYNVKLLHTKCPMERSSEYSSSSY